MNIEDMDFVYIIKPNEKGTDLRYSLRSIAKYYPNNKVWIVGYKPSWVINVEYLPVSQNGTKWSNSTNNVIKACECEEISENFILMNDDFFCINPSLPLETIIDSSLGSMDNAIDRYKKMHGNWAKGFEYVNELMNKLHFEKPYYSYEAHLPLRINKKKFLEVISLPEVQSFMKTAKVLHKRTLYKNYDKPENINILKHDVKIIKGKDTSTKFMEICGWLSTADDIIDNIKYPYINQLLRKNLSEHCKYEMIKKSTETKKKKDKFLRF